MASFRVADYLEGEGGAVDLVEARRLFGLAAAQGYAPAQNNLARMQLEIDLT